MTAHAEATTARLYQGLWGILARWFRVPVEPPTLPTSPGESAKSFRPDRAWLRYLKLKFWVGAAFAVAFVLVNTLAVAIAEPAAGLVLLIIESLFVVVPVAVAFVALHLRYDTTWYVMSDRSLRIRRGIWVIRETTITFENVQNVELKQGPLQRHFGFANLIVQTAGGGGGGGKSPDGRAGGAGGEAGGGGGAPSGGGGVASVAMESSSRGSADRRRSAVLAVGGQA